MDQKQLESLEKIGSCAYSAIVEMVDALDRKASAVRYAATKTADQCRELLVENDAVLDGDEDLESLQEMLADMIDDEAFEPDDFEFDEEAASEAIQEDPLSLEVRSGWTSMGSDLEAEEYCLLLSTGGPAVRIIGELNNGEPTSAKLEVQDWWTPWTEYRKADDDVLMKYVGRFYFGD